MHISKTFNIVKRLILIVQSCQHKEMRERKNVLRKMCCNKMRACCSCSLPQILACSCHKLLRFTLGCTPVVFLGGFSS